MKFSRIQKETEGDTNRSSAREAWLGSLPDAARELLAMDEKYFFRQSLSTPCMNALKGAGGIYLEDLSGKKIMDFHGNSVHQLGYGNRAVIDAIKAQIDVLPFSPRRYTNYPAVELARLLCEKMPGEYKALFTPSGAASVSVALKLARLYTGKYKVISLWDSFHGANLDTISVGGEGMFRGGMGPLTPGAEHLMPYNSYRCVFRECGACGLKCLDYLEYMMRCEGDVGAVIMEPVRSTDVQIPPREYYEKLREICDRFGAVLIFDEIPTALGRTGELFAFQNYSIAPDILILGKGLGGGVFPMSAVVAKAEMDMGQETAVGHYTHEKSPVGAAAALAVFRFIEETDLLGHVRQLNAIFRRRLERLKENFEVVGDVRLIGALAGIELVSSRLTKEKGSAQAERVMYGCLREGLSFKVSQGCVLTLVPPLTIGETELETAMDIIEEQIRRVDKNAAV